MGYRTLPLATLLLLLATSSPAQDESSAPSFERIHIIGASVSGGFEDGPLFGAERQGDSVTLQRILKKWCGGEARVTTHPPMEMWNLFRDPDAIGKKEVDLAKRREPDLVLAIDFPFWFAYGYVRGDEREARLARLERGLELLRQLDAPVIIGDLPDMAGAARRMISPRQIPSPELLRELNERLKRFVNEHDDVTQVSLADVVRQLKVDGVELPLQGGKLKTVPGALLQEDKLHATRLGMALLAFRMQDALRGRCPDGHPLRGQQWTFEQFVDAAGADIELEGLVQKAAAATGK